MSLQKIPGILLMLLFIQSEAICSDPVQLMRASTISLRGKSIPLSAALKVIHEQTGNTVEDRRRQFGQPATDIALDLDFERTPFWKALDAICQQAKLQMFALEAENRLGLIARRGAAPPQVAYAGPFRISMKRIESKPPTATLQIHWEPRCYPFFLKVADDSFQATDAQGQLKPTAQTSLGTVPLLGQQGRELQVRLPAGDGGRIVKELRGKLTAYVAMEMADFEFQPLTQGARKVQKGVAVSLKEFNIHEDVWSLGLTLEYPGLDLESHQGFVTEKNEISLERNGALHKSRRHLMSVIEDGPISVTYEFGNLPGKPQDYRLRYRAPAAPEEYTIEFGFKNLAIP